MQNHLDSTVLLNIYSLRRRVLVFNISDKIDLGINLGRTTVTYMNKLALSASAAAALVFTALTAHAQLAPPAPKAAPAVPAAPAAKAPPAAPGAPAAARVLPAKKPAAPVSTCNKLEEKSCATNTDCSWIAATKRKDGKEVSAYCRNKPKSTKAAPKKVDAKAATPAAATTAPTAPPAAARAPAAPAAKAPPATTK